MEYVHLIQDNAKVPLSVRTDLTAGIAGFPCLVVVAVAAAAVKHKWKAGYSLGVVVPSLLWRLPCHLVAPRPYPWVFGRLAGVPG